MSDLGKEVFRRDLGDAEMAQLEEQVEASEAAALALAAEAEAAYRATGLPEPVWRPKPRRLLSRSWLLALASACLALALLWTWQPGSRSLQGPAFEEGAVRGAGGLRPAWRVSFKGKAVLTLRRGPGFLRSTAALEPGQRPPRHAFVDAQALDPMHEDALRRLLLASKDFDDFTRRLKAAGYTLEAPEGAGRQGMP